MLDNFKSSSGKLEVIPWKLDHPLEVWGPLCGNQWFKC